MLLQQLVTRRKPILLAAGCTLFAASFFPVQYLAAPAWDVTVVTETGAPLAGVSARLSFQNYSAESGSHEITLTTDASGRASFSEQHGHASLIQYVLYGAHAAAAGAHANFGRHAYVFAFGRGYQGNAISGAYVTDWTGTPDKMTSRIVATLSKD